MNEQKAMVPMQSPVVQYHQHRRDATVQLFYGDFKGAIRSAISAQAFKVRIEQANHQRMLQAAQDLGLNSINQL